MGSRLLEKRVEVNLEDNRKTFELEYYLIETKIDDIEELKDQTVYGIEIVKKVDNKEVEGQKVKDFSSSIENVKSLINKLADNIVTPVSMMFVIDDIVGVW